MGKYTKINQYKEEIYERRARGETNREIAESYGLTKKQIKQLITRENRKMRRVAEGELLRPKGRPRKEAANEEEQHIREIEQLRMTVELLRNFLCEAGRR